MSDPYQIWASVPQEQREAALRRAGLAPAGDPSRRRFRHPILWARRELRLRRFVRRIRREHPEYR